jgi:hypothetical protein
MFFPIEVLASTRIIGEWLACNDGITRPAVRARLQAADGSLRRGEFLIDSCADRTVFGAAFMRELGFAMTAAPEDLSLKGITGECGFVVARTVIKLPRDDGGVAMVRGEFAAFTDDSATDLNILGRDVLNIFDVILSYRRREVLLLTEDHTYRVISA